MTSALGSLTLCCMPQPSPSPKELMVVPWVSLPQTGLSTTWSTPLVLLHSQLILVAFRNKQLRLVLHKLQPESTKETTSHSSACQPSNSTPSEPGTVRDTPSMELNWLVLMKSLVIGLTGTPLTNKVPSQLPYTQMLPVNTTVTSPTSQAPNTLQPPQPPAPHQIMESLVVPSSMPESSDISQPMLPNKYTPPELHSVPSTRVS